MTWTKVDEHFYQDVYWSSSIHFIDKRQRTELILNALSIKANWV